MSFSNRRERIFMDLWTLVLNFGFWSHPGKWWPVIFKTNKFLRYRTLCKSILTCGFPTKGIELTRFVIIEVPGVPQLWDIAVWIISVGSVKKFAKYKWDYKIKIFSVLDKFVWLCICSQYGVLPLPWCCFPVLMKAFRQSGMLCTVLREEVIIFRWCCRGLSLIERNLKKWILSTKSSCKKR